MKRLLLAVLSAIFLCNYAHASLSDHFKKADGKSDRHSFHNIDFIYTINLDQRPEKFESCTKQLHPHGIYPYRFSAVNGWELSLEAINDVGIKYHPHMAVNMPKGLLGTSYLFENNGEVSHEVISKPGKIYFSHCMGRGPIGIVLSHLSILQDAYDSGYETIWVMEDDIEIIRDPKVIPSLIDRLDRLAGKAGWDILYTDRNTKNQEGKYIPATTFAPRPNYKPANPGKFSCNRPIGKDFIQLGARYGAYSMIIRRSGMKKILNFFKAHSIFLPYDMEIYVPVGMRIFTVTRDVVSTQISALSDNGAPNYLKKNAS